MKMNDIQTQALTYGRKVFASVKKHAPSIAIIGGCFGVGYAAWKACEATPKAKEAVNDFKATRVALDESNILSDE